MNSTSFTSIASACAGTQDKMANIDTSSTAHLTLNAVAGSRPSRSARWSSTNSDSDPDRSPSVTVLSPSGATGSGNNHHHHVTHHSLSSPTSNFNSNGNSLTASSLASRPTQFISSGFSFNRFHFPKHQRNLWSRATAFEKVLMLVVIILGTTNILLFISLLSVYTTTSQHQAQQSQQQQVSQDLNATPSPGGPLLPSTMIESTSLATKSNSTAPTTTNTRDHKPNESNESKELQMNNTRLVGDNSGKKYCLTPDCVRIAASIIEAIDLTVDPCDDFYVSIGLDRSEAK